MLILVSEAGSQKALADQLERTKEQINALCRSKPMGDALAKAIEAKLLKPKGWMDTDHSGSPELEAGVPPKDGGVLIRRFDVVASMGPGREPPTGYVDVIDRLMINKDYLRALVPQFTNPKNLSIMSAFGDSMKGTYDSGDWLLVDTGINTINDEGVYAVIYLDQLHVKRFQRVGRSLMMISDNRKKYEPVVIDVRDSSDFIVLARVLIAWPIVKLC